MFNKLSKEKILDLKDSWRPTLKLRNQNLELKKQMIRDVRNVKRLAYLNELNWIENNMDKATKIYKSGAREFGGEANIAAMLQVRNEAINPYIQKLASDIRAQRLKKTVGAAAGTLLATPFLTALGEGVYNNINNLINSSDKTTFDDVKNNKDFINYLYKSGGENAPGVRKINNVTNVVGNYLLGLLNPHGNTLLDFGEGTERLAVATSLNNLLRKGNGDITDIDHSALGGKHGDSGQSFHGQNKDTGFINKLVDQVKNAANLPYHNIYGLSAGNTFDSNGFHSHADNYTFNNVWGLKPNKKVGVIKVLNDGEGDSSLFDALRQTFQAYKDGVTGIQPLMETAASLRGVNTKRHKDVSDISMEQLNKWAREYNRQKR